MTSNCKNNIFYYRSSRKTENKNHFWCPTPQSLETSVKTFYTVLVNIYPSIIFLHIYLFLFIRVWIQCIYILFLFNRHFYVIILVAQNNRLLHRCSIMYFNQSAIFWTCGVFHSHYCKFFYEDKNLLFSILHLS